MTWLMLALMLALSSPSAFGQTATTTATSTPPYYSFVYATSSPFQVVRDYLSGATTTVPSLNDIHAEAEQIYIRDYWGGTWQTDCLSYRGTGPGSLVPRGVYYMVCGPSTTMGLTCSNLDEHQGIHLHCTNHLGLTPMSPILTPTHQRPYNPFDPNDRPYGMRSRCGFSGIEDYAAGGGLVGETRLLRVVKDYAEGCRDTIPSMAEIAAEAQYWCSTALGGELRYVFQPSGHPTSRSTWYTQCFYTNSPRRGHAKEICRVEYPFDIVRSPIGRRYTLPCTATDGDGRRHSEPYLGLDTSRGYHSHTPPKPAGTPSNPIPEPVPTPEPEPTATSTRARLEVPANGSFQSGIGFVSGWACEGERIQIIMNGGLHLPPVARNISRGDTEAVCGDTENGFITQWNWNLLGEGTYTAALVVNGQTMQTNTFTVTTMGQEFIKGLERDVEVQDFPSPGENTRLRWQEPVQGFVLVPGSEPTPTPEPTATSTRARLEVPDNGSFQSGIGFVSGWACEGELVEIVIDGGLRIPPVARNISRGDTEAACGDQTNGFITQWNWNLLGEGT